MIDENTASVKTTIDDFRPVDEKISNRAGLALVAKYLSAIGITQMLADRFGFLKKSAKRAPLRSIFHQLILFFFDGTDFHLTRFDALGLGFVIGGKMYADLKACIGDLPEDQFFTLKKDRRSWLYCEFGNRRKSWDQFYRTLYTKPLTEEDGQFTFEFQRPETILYTNLGMRNRISEQLCLFADHQERFFSAEAVIGAYHERARDERVNRGLKNFGVEHLPFKGFTANAAFYYLMGISFVLFESFKVDMDSAFIPITWYATTFRRRLLDIAGKIVRSARRLTLALPRGVCEDLDIGALWRKLSEIHSIDFVLQPV